MCENGFLGKPASNMLMLAEECVAKMVYLRRDWTADLCDVFICRLRCKKNLALTTHVLCFLD